MLYAEIINYMLDYNILNNLRSICDYNMAAIDVSSRVLPILAHKHELCLVLSHKQSMLGSVL